jgi:hypothetical protein
MKTLLALLAASIAVALVACGGDDDEVDGPTTVLTPVGTKAETPTPAQDGGGGSPVTEPAHPELDEELTEVASDTLNLVIVAGGTYVLHTVETVAEASGDAGLTCDTAQNFAFGFSWQVVSPWPPDGVQLAWQITRDSGPVEIASGTAGEQTVGCDTLTAANSGLTPVTVVMKYRAGVIQ